jgi:Tol biopolymer transport system component
MRITVKSLQVLMVLVAQQGKVVSREALIEWVWADTMPSDDVLTQAIAQLRKAFGDDRGAPKYVETIAKGGYRLLAPVEWIHPADDVQAPATQSAPPVLQVVPGRRLGWYLVGAVVVLALAGFGYRMLRDRQAAPPVVAQVAPPTVEAKLEYQRITSAPGSEMWPSLSPDGSQVVYSAYSAPDSASLMVQTTAPVPGRPLTTPSEGVQDTMPVWSPNGREIAFARIGPKDACSLLLIPASGGEARTISACRPGWLGSFSWHPDGEHLVTSMTGTGPQLDGALYTIDLGSGAWSRLPYEKDPKDSDLTPAYSPDGRWIAFHRNISMSDLWRVPAQGGKPERLTDLASNINSVAWAPDGKSIVFGAYLDEGLSLARLDLQTREVHPLGLPNTLAASVAANAPAAAFVIVEPHSRVFSLDLAAGDAADAVPLFPSTGVDLLPAVAPDHEQIAFVSDRSATDALWWARISRPESLRLIERLIPVPRYAPAWSPDSTRMLVIGRTDSDKGLYEVTAQSGSVQWLPVPSGKPVHAEYMPDPSQVLVVANREAGRLDVTLYDRTTQPWKALASHDDVAMAKVDALRHRILITRPSEDGLWEADLALRNIRRIHDRPAFGGGRRLIPTEKGLWLAAATEGCGLRLIEISGPTEQPGRCLHREPIDITGVSFDEKHQRLYFSAEQGDSSDIGWARLPETTATSAIAMPSSTPEAVTP